MTDEETFHPVGACILSVDGNLPSSSARTNLNLVVSEVNDSYDMDGPAIYDVQPNGLQRYFIGKLKGFIGPRMEARSFWYGLGHRAGIKVVAQTLPLDAPMDESVGVGNNRANANEILVIVKAQCGVFDVREFKKGEREERDQRPGRALNALLKYCESEDLPESCRPFYNAKALKALTKRPISLKDIGVSVTSASGASLNNAGTADKAKKEGTKAAVSKKRPASAKHTKKNAKK